MDRSEPRRRAAVADVLESRLLLSAIKFHKPAAANPPAIVAQPATISLNTTNWTPLGPAPSINGPIAGSGAVTGRINAVAADPANVNVIYVGAAGGGVWKSADGGTTWTALTDSQSTLNTGALAIAPSNSSIIYAGTGDGTGSTQSFYGKGVLKSTDAGITWTLLGNSVFNRHNIAKVIVDPTNANTVYVAVPGGGMNGLSGSTGIWKSTDGGTTWANTTSSIDTNGRWADVAMDPSNSQRLIATLAQTTAKNGLYVSTNGGGAWTLINGGAPVGTAANNARVAFSVSSPLVAYTSWADTTNRVLGIWKSVNGGANWSQLSNVPEYLDGGGVYDDSLAVNPTDPNVVYAGGTSKIIQSHDGGQTWADITVGAGGTSGTGIEHESAAFDANGRLLDVNGNGIFRLDNPAAGAISWSDLNGNLNVTQFLSAAVDPTTTDKIIAAGQDNGIAQYSGSLSWTKPDAGVDGGVIRISAQNPSRVYRQVPNTSTATGNFIRRSDDGGVTWVSDTNGIYPIDPQNYYAPMAIDPNNGNHLLYGTSRVYETFNGGNTWTPISTPFLNGWTLGIAGTVAQLAIAPSDPNTIYAAGGGNIYVTTNDGASWTLRNPGNSPIGGIVVDPQNSRIVFDVGSSFGGNKVLRTMDGGVTWQNLTGNLPDLPTNALAINGTTFYVGNDSGVYTSIDDGTTWAKLATGLPNVEVRDLQYDPVRKILTAATFGRGVWQISTATTIPLTVNTLADETNAGDGLLSLREAIATSNSTGQSIGFDPSLSGGTIALDPANGPLMVSKSFSILGPGTGSLSINAASASMIEVAGGVNAQFFGVSLGGTGTPLQIDATGQATLVGASLGTVGVTDNGTLAFDQLADGSTGAAITGTGALLKNGPYTLTLSGSTSITGGMTVRGGILKGSTNALQRNIVVNVGAAVVFDESSLAASSGVFGGAVSGTGSVRVLGPGTTMTMGTFGAGVASNFTNTGSTNIDAGATLIASAVNDLGASSLYTVDGNLDLGGFNQSIGSLAGASTGAIFNRSTQANLTATVKVTENSATTYLGVLRDVPASSGASGVLALNKAGSAVLTLAGSSANTYTGGTTVAGSIVGNSQTIEGTYASTGGVTIDQSLGGIGDGSTKLNLSGGGTLAVQSGIVRLAAGSTLTNVGGTTIAGTLVGPGSAGTNAFSASSSYVVNGTLDLGGFDQTLINLSGAGVITNSHSGLATLTVATGSASMVFAGTISDHPVSGGGTIAIKKTGSGTLTIQGANTYSGGTTVAGGTIAVGPSEGDPLGTGALSIISPANGISLQGRMTGPVQQTLALTGFNQDVIAEASAADALSSTTVGFDGSGTNLNNVWYEAGFGGAFAQGTGLPASGSTFTSLANPAVNFKLQPFNANNVAFMGQAQASATLQLAAPSSFQSLNFLAAAATGNATISVTLNFADGSTTTTSQFLSDWFNGANPVLMAGGRITRTAGTSVTLAAANPRLYEFDLRLSPADQVKVLNSVSFSETSGATSGIFAISGTKWALTASQAYANAVQLTSGATLSIANSPNASFGAATINNGGGSITISGAASSATSLSLASLSLGSDADFAPGPGASLSLGPISDSGTHSLIIGGDATSTVHLTGANSYGATHFFSGTLSVDAGGGLPNNGQIHIYGGRVILQPQVTPFSYHLTAIELRPGSVLDIGNNKVFVNYSALGTILYADIRRAIINGYDGGKFDGQGPVIDNTIGTVISTSVAQDVTLKHGIGSGASNDNNFLPPSTYEFAYALYGDATLDGVVDQTDVDRFNQNYPNSSNMTWGTADFNYDGATDLNDYALLRRNDPAALPFPLQATLVSDVNVATGDAAPHNAAVMNGHSYFAADDGLHGSELWSTDGTAAGTYMVNELNGGPLDSEPRNLTVVGNKLFYVEGVRSVNVDTDYLWVTDGTTATPSFLKFIYAPVYNSITTTGFVAANGKLVFVADNNSLTAGVWSSDGTQGGTQLISPDNVTAATQLTVIGTTVYFVNGGQLWKTDGTSGGTTMVRDFSPVTSVQIAAAGTTLFVSVDQSGNSLWKSDGTEGGTVPVATLPAQPTSMTAIGSTLFFVDSDDSSVNKAIWKSDGTGPGTSIVAGTHNMLPSNLIVMGGKLFFQTGSVPTHIMSTDGTTTVDVAAIGGQLSGFTPVSTRLYFTVGGPNAIGAPVQLWYTDGTSAGTQQVSLPGQGPKLVQPLVALGTNLLFGSDDLVHGSEPWITDGTTSGTKMVTDLNAMDAPSSPTQFTASGPWIYFAANDDANGRQIWKFGATNIGATRVTSINAPFGADPQNLTDFQHVLYFTATYYPDPSSSTPSTRLWRTDGTAAGTYIMLDAGGHQLDSPTSLLVRDGYLFFVANDTGPGGQRSVYRTDGTAAGTGVYATAPTSGGGVLTVAGPDNLLLDINSEIYRVNPNQTVDLGHGATTPGTGTNVHQAIYGTKLFYIYQDPTGSLSLYSTDGGSAAGLVKSLTNSRYLSSVPEGSNTFTTANGLLFFETVDNFGVELWKSDGTTAGTTVLNNLTSVEPVQPMTLASFNSAVYFVKEDMTHGFELWKSNGTPAGTVLVDDIHADSFGSYPQKFLATANGLYFQADNEFYRTDGTAAGTAIVQYIRNSGWGALPTSLAAINGTLYFGAEDGVHGVEPWALNFPDKIVMSGGSPLTLVRDSNSSFVDWSAGIYGGKIAVNDANGMSLVGDGSNDTITLDFSNGNPLPNIVHLNGVFTITGLDSGGANPLAGTTLDIGRSTVYFSYAPGQSPVSAIRQYLSNGYNGGGWNGVAAAGSGAIASASIAGGPDGAFGIGYADWADGIVGGQPANTVEVRYTVMGDSNLDGTVNSIDAILLARNYNTNTGWDKGNFNYDSTINMSDALILQKNFNVTVVTAAPSVQSAVAPLIPVVGAAPVQVAAATNNPIASNNSSSGLTSAGNVTSQETSKKPHRSHTAKKRR
jgi:ELWxxDGT repeat protein/autotransporter-associated beta strand protein